MKKEPLCMTHQTKADGSVPISEELRSRWGLTTGSPVVIRETPAGLLISPQDPPLGRVYIEPTTECNLNCQTCMRHSWDEPIGLMDMPAFRRLIDFDFPPCVNCGGCHFSETNEEDCFGNPFPVCGDCLWARNVIVCP